MERKGQVGVGGMLMLAITIIVGLVILSGTFGFIGQTTSPSVNINQTINTGLPGTFVDLTGQELLSTPIVVNRTGQQVIDAGNYTITEGISSVTGMKRVRFSLTAAGGASGWNSSNVNVSYSYGQEGYIDDAGGRGVASLILLMSFLALIVVVIGYVMKEKFF